ncbi:uncharacterized protein LOC142542078 [Primulina tabacum]|uniref:uncharacterized protein LOC142542078 n=1 Tax=Primulina tabacum TaxID=48773 RepID=UPI003F5AAD30
MAVDICSEISSPFATPRIPFSHDPIREEDDNIVAVDFNFCIIQNLSQPISSADELFANGKILPLKSKKIQTHQTDPIQAHSKPRKITTPPHKTIENPIENTKKKRLVEFLSTSFDADDEQEDSNKRLTKPFWKFRRSSSACENGGNSSNSGLLRSLHFLTRSNSTGSAPNPNPNPKHKVMQKQHSTKESSNLRSSPIQYYPYYNTAERPYLNKSSNRSYGNGVRISPVLNIPPTYIAKGRVSFFGIGSFFCSKKSKKKKK